MIVWIRWRNLLVWLIGSQYCYGDGRYHFIGSISKDMVGLQSHLLSSSVNESDHYTSYGWYHQPLWRIHCWPTIIQRLWTCKLSLWVLDYFHSPISLVGNWVVWGQLPALCGRMWQSSGIHAQEKQYHQDTHLLYRDFKYWLVWMMHLADLLKACCNFCERIFQRHRSWPMVFNHPVCQ